MPRSSKTWSALRVIAQCVAVAIAMRLRIQRCAVRIWCTSDSGYVQDLRHRTRHGTFDLNHRLITFESVLKIDCTPCTRDCLTKIIT